jgi:hypothetical protein
MGRKKKPEQEIKVSQYARFVQAAERIQDEDAEGGFKETRQGVSRLEASNCSAQTPIKHLYKSHSPVLSANGKFDSRYQRKEEC